MLEVNAVTYAGFWKRVVASFLDGIVVVLCNLVVWAFFSIGMTFGGGSMDESDEAVAGLLILLSWVLVSWGYFAFSESSPSQATPGKLALSIKVTDLEGQPVGFGKATGRHFGKVLFHLGPLLLLFLTVAFTEKKQGLHDMAAGCLVVNK